MQMIAAHGGQIQIVNPAQGVGAKAFGFNTPLEALDEVASEIFWSVAHIVVDITLSSACPRTASGQGTSRSSKVPGWGMTTALIPEA